MATSATSDAADSLSRLYILPNLQTLIWRCETPAGLERSLLFLSPHLQHLVLDIGMRIPNLDLLIGELPKRTKLSTLSISSITPLPDNFTQAMSDQRSLESLSLSVPGALTPALGRWIASLPKLRRLQLDLTARSFASIEAFFQGIDSPSGYLTPTSLGATDNDIFSGGEELDFDSRKDRRRNSRHISGDCPAVRFTRPGAGFLQLEEVQLTGDAGTLAAFLKHLPGEVATLELIVDDPPERLDWKDLWLILNERFPDSLHTIRISPTSASRPELLRSLSRGENPAITPQLLALPVENFPNLPNLRKLDVDLPHSVIIVNADVEALAISCPALEVLRLCPTARFPITSDAPRLTLDGLAPLTRYCTRLHTLAVVLSALPQRDDVPESQMHSSPSLLRLNVGHSWLKDPLQTAILLSHLAPHLRVLRYFHEANRPGYVAAHASAWQQVTLFLPRLQRLRAVERKASQDALDRLVRARQEPDQPPTPVHEQHFTAHPLNAVLERGPGSRESDAVGCLIPALAEKVDKAVDAALPDDMIHLAAVMVDAAVQTVQMLPDSHATVIPSDVAGARDVPSAVIVADCSIISGQDVIQTRVLVSEPVPDPDAPTAAGDDRRVRQPQRRPLTVAVAAPNLLASLDKLSGIRAKAARSDVLPARPSSLSIREVFFYLPLYLGLLLLNTALRLMSARLSRTLSSAKPSSHPC
jgi:hypothetical protein